MFEQISINHAERSAKEMDAVLIDLRSKEEYQQGHIKGAINLPYEELEQNFPYGKEKTVILYCELGIRSMRASKQLFEQGYTVINTIGGVKQYSGALVK